MSYRTDRSTAAPKFAVKAGLIAAASLGVSQVTPGETPDDDVSDGWVRSESFAAVELGSSSDLVFNVPAQEEWDEKIHKKELRVLIVKKATSDVGLSRRETARLLKLQEMRRSTLPLAQSYDEFIREYDRKIELQHLVEMLADYKQKYEIPVHV